MRAEYQMGIQHLAKDIYKQVLNLEKQHPGDLVVTNRIIANDFAKLMQLTALDYSPDCILVERLFLRQFCEKQEIEVEEPSKKEIRLRNQFNKLAIGNIGNNDKDKLAADAKEMKKLLTEIQAMKRVIRKREVLTFRPFTTEDNFIMLPIEKNTKEQYRLFCEQLAEFVFVWFSTMRMMDASMLQIGLYTVKGVNSIDIIAQLKNGVL